jgi:lipopolysaccharide transport system permease protein
MNPHVAPPASPAALLLSISKHRQLIGQMIRREVVGRYKGSALGLGWSFFNPLLMLSVYTFVFSIVFKARWGVTHAGEPESKAMFAVVLFIGLIVHALFSDILTRAPTLITGNVNYVKKVVFPLEILPVVTTGAALFHAVISLGVWLLAYLIFVGPPHWTLLLLPLILLPLIVLALGCAWFLASLGVFLRDVSQTIGILVTVLMFTAPVFFPIGSLPPRIQPLVMLNPLTFIITEARDVAIWGTLPRFEWLAVYFAISALFAAAGFAWFQKTRKGFADVL